MEKELNYFSISENSSINNPNDEFENFIVFSDGKIIGYEKQPILKTFYNSVVFYLKSLNDKVTIFCPGRMVPYKKCDFHMPNYSTSDYVSVFALLHNSKTSIYKDINRNDYCVEKNFPILICFETLKYTEKDFQKRFSNMSYCDDHYFS